MCAELCDGWLAMLFSPEHQDLYLDPLREGFARDGARRTLDDFEIAATVPVIVSEDVDAAVDALRPFYALYFGGMGAKGANFHANVPIRMGYEKEILEIQDLYLAGKKDEAGARIPGELIQQLSLVGPREKIRDDLERWRESIVTTLLVSGDAATLRSVAELVLGAAPRRPRCARVDVPAPVAQSLAVTASSRCLKRSREASRRVGRCSLGTPSAGGS